MDAAPVDAFKTLLKNARQPSSSQKSSQPKRVRYGSQQQAEKYTLCPLCGGNIPKSFLDLHVETCLASSTQRTCSQSQQQQQQQQQQGTADRSQALTPSPATDHGSRQPPPSATAMPPPAAAAAAGPAEASAAATPEDEDQLVASGTAVGEAAPEVHQHRPTPTSNPPPGSGSAVKGAAPPRNAFKVLQQAARQQQPAAATFFLQRTIEGGWAWHWWWKAEGPTAAQQALTPTWSAKVQLKPHKGSSTEEQPAAAAGGGGSGVAASSSSSSGGGSSSSVQVVLTLQTDLPSGDGAEVSWSNLLLASNHAPWPAADRGTTCAASNPRAAAGGAGAPMQQHRQQAAPAAAQTSSVAGPTGGGSSSSGGPLRWRGGISVMKSALQKNIRLGRAAEAVRVALSLLKEDPGELLRRLAIIVVEDTLLHPATPALVWLMAAQAKGYVLSGTAANLVLGVVQQLATAPVKDFLPDPPILAQLPSSFQGVDKALPSTPAEALLVKALLVRAAFGGMPGDVVMLKGYAAQWAARFAAKLGAPPQLPSAPPTPTPAAAAPGAQHAARSSSSNTGSAEVAQPAGTGAADSPSTAAATSAAAGPGITAGSSGMAPHGETSAQHSSSSSSRSSRSRRASRCWPSSSTPWSLFLQQCCDAADAAAAAAGLSSPRVTLVGPLRPGDIPLTAVDFHVSEVAPHLLHDSRVRAVLQQLAAAGWGPDADPEQLVRRVLWLCASSVNGRPWVQGLQQQQQQQQEPQRQQQQPKEHHQRQQQEQRGPPLPVDVQHQQQELQQDEEEQQGRQQQQQDVQQVQDQQAEDKEHGTQLNVPDSSAVGQQQQQQAPAEPTAATTTAPTPSSRPTAAAADVDLLLTWHLLERDEERDAAQRERLAPLWQVAQPLAAAYARGFIARRLTA